MKKTPFVERVEQAMRRRKLSLRAVCRALKLDPSFFSKVLAGKRSPPSDEAVLRQLAAVLGLDPIELIVSTGRIPLEWQPLFSEPEALQAIRRLAEGAAVRFEEHPRREEAAAAARPAPAPRPQPSRVIGAPRLRQTERPLSDDLL